MTGAEIPINAAVDRNVAMPISVVVDRNAAMPINVAEASSADNRWHRRPSLSKPRRHRPQRSSRNSAAGPISVAVSSADNPLRSSNRRNRFHNPRPRHRPPRSSSRSNVAGPISVVVDRNAEIPINVAEGSNADSR